MTIAAPEHSGGDSLFWLSAVVMGGAYLALEHGFVSGDGFPAVGGILVLSSLGVFGLALLLAPARRPVHPPDLLAGILVAAGIAMVTGPAGWSDPIVLDSPSMLGGGCLLAVAIGLGRQFHVRELVGLMLVAVSCGLVSDVTREVVSGVFRPQWEHYQFVGSATSDVQAMYCAVLTVTSVTVLRHARRYLPLYLGLVAGGVLSLLLTRSLAGCGAVLIAVLAMLLLQPRPATKSPVAWWLAPGWVVVLTLICEQGLGAGEQRVAVPSAPGMAGLVAASCGMLVAWRRFLRTDDECYRTLVAQLVMAMVLSQRVLPWGMSLVVVLTAASLFSLSQTPLRTASRIRPEFCARNLVPARA